MIYVALFLPSEGMSREKESLTARALLSDFYINIFGSEPPKIKKSELGKPYFDFPSSPPFSISHSDGAVAVAISDENADVGIDVQSEIEAEKACRISHRFPFVKERFFEKIANVCVFKAALNRDGFSFEELSVSPCQKNEFTLWWTSTEAVLKADGGGFTSSKKLDELEKICSVFSFEENGIYVSLAVLGRYM